MACVGLRRVVLAVAPIALLGAVASDSNSDSDQARAPHVDFMRDVRPVLQANCFRCHSAARKKGGLRLDLRADVVEGPDPLVLGHDLAGSLLWERVNSSDEGERMPPVGDGLDEHALGVLRRWIESGASWPSDVPDLAALPHWAYVAPQRAALPVVNAADWVRNPIDTFVLARLEESGIAPAPEATKETLLRRASLDLLGLPPTLAELDAFLADDRPEAFELALERLFASPHHGERMAQHWLDLARYADTHGFQKDYAREMWPFRDWVIDAFQSNLPFDQFTIEQLAGDLLPDPTRAQLIATGFHRNTMINAEAGVDPEEFRNATVVDRTNTTASVWLGSTLACAQCHDHKYDPFSQREYYELFAFFNSSTDTSPDVRPTVTVPSPAQLTEMETDRARIAELRAAIAAPRPAADQAQTAWEGRRRDELDAPPMWQAQVPRAEVRAGASGQHDDVEQVAAESVAQPNRHVIELQPGAGLWQGLRLDISPRAGDVLDFALAEVGFQLDGGVLTVAAASADSERAGGHRVRRAIDGSLASSWRPALNQEAPRASATFVFTEPVPCSAESVLRVELSFDEPPASVATRRYELSLAEENQWLTGLDAVRCGPWSSVGPFPAESGEVAFETAFKPETEYVKGRELSKRYRKFEAAWSERPDALDGSTQLLDGESCAHYLHRTLDVQRETGIDLYFGSDDSIKVWVDRELVLENPAIRAAAPEQERVRRTLAAGKHSLLVKVVNYSDTCAFWFDWQVASGRNIDLSLAQTLFKAPDERTGAEAERLRLHFRNYEFTATKVLFRKQRSLERGIEAILQDLPTTMVMRERATPRVTHLQERGSFLLPGELVQPDVPDSLPALPEGGERNRLDLARWLMSPSNPLTARVAVNRLWALVFGSGLVRTPEDFGTRGELPTHPALLDWLAVEFMASGWDVQALMKLMLTSATYRQRSDWRVGLADDDPDNRLLARAARVRLDAEFMRDSALSIGGLLNGTVKGPSVFPSQPAGSTLR